MDSSNMTKRFLILTELRDRITVIQQYLLIANQINMVTTCDCV